MAIPHQRRTPAGGGALADLPEQSRGARDPNLSMLNHPRMCKSLLACAAMRLVVSVGLAIQLNAMQPLGAMCNLRQDNACLRELVR